MAQKTLSPEKVVARNRAHDTNGLRAMEIQLAARRTGAGRHWMEDVKAKRAMERALKAVRTSRLVGECPAMRSVVSTYGNVFALATATTEAIRAVPGCGPKKRQAIKEYLATKNVRVEWEV